MIKKFLPEIAVILLIIAATLPAVMPIIRPGFFPMHDDLQAMRQLQMSKCFADGQIPCRWVPDMGYGFGYPLFNYYPPLPYYLGQIFHLLGFSFLDIVKILFVLAFLLSAFGMYLFAREFWGKLGGAIAAIFYVWTPYHAVDVYVRGAMNEAWAMVFFPLVLFSVYKIIKENSWKYLPLTALAIGLLLISHLPTLVVFAPGVLLWVGFCFWLNGSLKAFSKLAVAALLAFGLAAFFVIPLVFELKFVHFESLFGGYFNYLAHFVSLNQLFVSRSWGYGSSVLGPQDEMLFSLGHLHWFGSLAALLVAWMLRKRNSRISYIIIFFFGWIYFYAFLTHQRSSLIWRLVPILTTLQFPWRILAVSAVGTAFLAGSTLMLFERFRLTFRLFLTAVLILSVVVVNKPFFNWREFYPEMTDEQKFSGELWRLQQTSGIFDYLPRQLSSPPSSPPVGDAQIIDGDGEFKLLVKKSNLQVYQVSVKSNLASFQVNTFYFPGWVAIVDNQKVDINPWRDKINGTMIVDLPRGEHRLMVKFEKTKVRAIADMISAVSWFAFILLVFALNKPKTFK